MSTVRDPLVIPCSFCGVGAGVLCVTNAGGHAVDPHAARVSRVWAMKRSDYGRLAAVHDLESTAPQLDPLAPNPNTPVPGDSPSC